MKVLHVWNAHGREWGWLKGVAFPVALGSIPIWDCWIGQRQISDLVGSGALVVIIGPEPIEASTFPASVYR